MDKPFEKPIRVLHVDDDKSFLEVSKECLQMFGFFDVDAASSVDEALEKMRKNVYDAIVCDYQMPGKNGLQLLEKLRKSGNNIPFIVFTGKGREDVAVEALSLGAEGYISKNGDPETVYLELASMIRLAVNKSKVEADLRITEARYKALFENTHDIVILTDAEGKIIDVNAAIYRYNFKREQLIGGNIIELLSLEPGFIKEAISWNMEKPVEGITEIKTLDGKVLATYKCKPLRVGDRSAGLQVFIKSLIEGAKLEKFPFEEALESLLAGVLIVDERTHEIIYANKHALEMIGARKEDVIGRICHCFVCPAERGRCPISDLGKTVDRSERVLLKANGEMIPILKTVTVITWQSRRYLVESFIDISEQKKAEKILRESEETYRAIINGMNDTVWVIDFNGKFIDVNDAAVKVLGYSREELLKMGPPDIDSSLTEDQIRELIRKMPKDKIQVFETTHKTKDGRIIPVEISSSLITYKGDTAILSIARDISERKKAEAKLKQLMEQLKMANEKLTVVGKWTRHDARNKLSVIKGNLYLVKKKIQGNNQLMKYLREIELACDQIAKIFDFASAYERLGIEERTYIDVGKVIEEARELSIGLNGIKLINNCHGLEVYADSQLRQLFYNLIENSIRHGERVRCIKVYYRPLGESIEIIYEDDGIGISEDNKSNLFREGYGKGTGYGLYFIKKLCEMYGWEIKEVGEYGVGVKFIITIPKVNNSGDTLYRIKR
ncbi:MAG: PAS domain S-box protein [Candidatus Bathyarchaeia archaeon]